MNEETSGLSRRAVLAGAAWSVPVIAVAAATPMAAASGGGRLTAAFIVAGDLGPTSDTIAGAIFIRNSSGEAVTLTPGDITITLEGLESADAPYMTTEFDADAVTQLGENSVAEGDNALFSAGSVDSEGQLVIVLAAGVVIAAGDELVIGFFFHWRANNPTTHTFVIAGFVVVDYGIGVGEEQLPVTETIDVSTPPD